MQFDRFTVVLLILRPDAPAQDEAAALALQDAHLAYLAPRLGGRSGSSGSRSPGSMRAWAACFMTGVMACVRPHDDVMTLPC
jgi:hypothetical protein